MTTIEWVKNRDGAQGKTWNPVTGCTQISPGCKNCYAKRQARRFAGRNGYPEEPNHFDVTLRPDRLEQPLARQKPTTYFVCSMSDLFHHEVPFAFVKEVWAVMAACPQHTFQILTKRAKLMSQAVDAIVNLGFTVLPNVWGGVSVEGPDYLWRIDELLKSPFAVRFVSVEPMLSAVDLSHQLQRMNYMPLRNGGEPYVEKLGISWVICGAESGPGRRPMQLDWARDLRDKCQSAGVHFFLKQAVIDGKMVKLPELDGRQWAEMPECR